MHWLLWRIAMFLAVLLANSYRSWTFNCISKGIVTLQDKWHVILQTLHDLERKIKVNPLEIRFPIIILRMKICILLPFQSVEQLIERAQRDERASILRWTEKGERKRLIRWFRWPHGRRYDLLVWNLIRIEIFNTSN